MPLDRERWESKKFYWFIIDGEVGWNKVGGWEWWIRTPLFGFGMSRNWYSFEYTSKTNRIWFGLISRQPTFEGEKMYRWSWDKEKVAATVYGREVDR